MRVEIDREACEGTAYCARVSAVLFVVEDGVARVARQPVTDAERDLALEAEQLCPTGAILVTEED